MRAAKVQAGLRIRAVSPEPPLLVHTSSESRGTFRQKARSLAPLNGWACAVKICHDGMLEDTKSLNAAHIVINQDFILDWLVYIKVRVYAHCSLHVQRNRQNSNKCATSTDIYHDPKMQGLWSLWTPNFLIPHYARRYNGIQWVDAQADLSLRWAHTHFVGFVMSRLITYWFVTNGILWPITPIELCPGLGVMAKWGYFPTRIVLRSATSFEKEIQCCSASLVLTSEKRIV